MRLGKKKDRKLVGPLQLIYLIGRQMSEARVFGEKLAGGLPRFPLDRLRHFLDHRQSVRRDNVPPEQEIRQRGAVLLPRVRCPKMRQTDGSPRRRLVSSEERGE
jgi:hypothetical protein